MAKQHEDRYIEILGGFSSRLTVLCSIQKFELDKKYKIIWDYQPGCYSKFDDIFVNNIGIIDKKNVDFREMTVQTFGSRYETHKYNPYLFPDWFNTDNILHSDTILNTSTYIVMDWPLTKGCLFNYGGLKNLLTRLKFRKDIVDTIELYSKQFTNNVIGVYYRGCEGSINYTPDSNNNPQPFIDIINRESQNNLVFVSTGSKLLYNAVKDIKNVITVSDQMYPIDAGYTVQGVKRSVIEFMLFSKVKKAFISGGGFIQKCCYVGDIKEVNRV